MESHTDKLIWSAWNISLEGAVLLGLTVVLWVLFFSGLIYALIKAWRAPKHYDLGKGLFVVDESYDNKVALDLLLRAGGSFQKLCESAVANSPIVSTVRKGMTWQANIYNEAGMLLGHAVRFKDYILTPRHVVAGHSIVVLEINGRTIAIDLDRLTVVSLHGDLIGFAPHPKIFSELQMTSAKAGNIGTSPMSVCLTATGLKKESYGTLYVYEGPSVAPGVCYYNGSTHAGFSGAGYHVGDVVYGIHQGGGVVNFGVDMAYIESVLVKKEGTADWLEKVWKKNPKKIRVSRHPINYDEYIVRVNGKYITVDYEDAERIFGDDLNNLDYEQFGEWRQPEGLTDEVRKKLAERGFELPPPLHQDALPLNSNGAPQAPDVEKVIQELKNTQAQLAKQLAEMSAQNKQTMEAMAQAMKRESENYRKRAQDDNQLLKELADEIKQLKQHRENPQKKSATADKSSNVHRKNSTGKSGPTKTTTWSEDLQKQLDALQKRRQAYERAHYVDGEEQTGGEH